MDELREETSCKVALHKRNRKKKEITRNRERKRDI